mmetsp:Transcript_6934/g.7986  ORF Transcript_6934/g.7986 Transcript_6934/m.7986 type:complete len:294 (-) Transcript_6934:94-975(-)|eukprot:CAMPEP_0184040040 /NCGR_PEP_ID=MMETSP0955-20130417/55772_1 /TAXON_ID=627963 /ORGANISM="Aplanochytrium sp, Strain PBS07" /LENGTH=293 /DNA_ID=CAMNT_0026329603 /DNA_START=37 /DNA_END=918 /DNA_ORIENTATION=-
MTFALGSTGQKLSELELHEWDAVKNHVEESLPLQWTDGDGKTFRVRTGPDYKKNGNKALSEDSLYECVAVDLVADPDKKIEHIASKAELPPPRDIDDVKAIELSGLPRLIVVNIKIPYKAASLMSGASHYDNDPGCSWILTFSIKPETVKEALGDNPRPGVRLLKTFISEWGTNEDIRRRFKVICHVDNVTDVPVRGISMLKGYNGKPAIINKMGDRFSDEKKSEYFELDLNITKGKYMSRKGLDQVRDYFAMAFARIGFVIQGEPDDELPEIVFGCANVRNVNLGNVTKVSL